ncbi:hypothetical protein MN608_03118 [Microdochium nivale]|nr:hypothetical protein MN608_03118 [Microdochium nivale]
MTSPFPKPTFLTRLPVEIRQEIYNIYTLNLLKEAGLSYEAFTKPEFDSEQEFANFCNFPAFEIYFLTPPLILTCKTIAAEYTPAAKQHAVVVYEMVAGDDSCTLAATSTFVIGRAHAADLHQVRVIWRIATEYFDDIPPSGLLEDCMLNAALCGQAPNITTILTELYDNRREETCANWVIQEAMEDTLDYFLKSAILDNGLKRLELVGYFRERWINAVERKYKKKLQIRRGRPRDPKPGDMDLVDGTDASLVNVRTAMIDSLGHEGHVTTMFD